MKDTLAPPPRAFFSRARLPRFLGFLLAALLAAPVQAACPPYADASVKIVPLYVPPRYDDTVSLARIRELAGQPDTRTGSLREIPVGLTAASLSLRTSFKIVSRPAPDDPATLCAQITEVTLRFGFEDTKVYLAQDMPRHSCAYETVLEHESRHVAADERVLAGYLPQLPALLAGEIRRLGVTRVADPAEAEADFQTAMNAYMQQLGDSVATVRQRAQSPIDSEAEYLRLSQSCDGEISRLISGDAR